MILVANSISIPTFDSVGDVVYAIEELCEASDQFLTGRTWTDEPANDVTVIHLMTDAGKRFKVIVAKE